MIVEVLKLAFPFVMFGIGLSIRNRRLTRALDKANAESDVIVKELWSIQAERNDIERECMRLRAELHASKVARAQAMLKKQVRELADQLAESKAQLNMVAESAYAVCEPIFTASDGGAMWCAMREKPGAKDKVERLKSTITKARDTAHTNP